MASGCFWAAFELGADGGSGHQESAALLLSLAGLALIPAVTLAAVEAALFLGWDPPLLRVVHYGVPLVQIDHQPGGSRAILHVRHRDGRVHDYEAEQNEHWHLAVGDTLRLEVIGRHVVGVRVLEKSPPSRLVDPLATRPHESRYRFASAPNLRTLALKAAMIPIGAGLIGGNLPPIFIGVEVFRRRRMVEQVTEPGLIL
ncbi:MAG: hypothetical protein MH204_03190, partial [Fimbriimonadaceae bacterium]|nr:hypothetical protein [Fimbriimonadaceae bacterium]